MNMIPRKLGGDQREVSQGVVHLVSFGYATVRNEDAIRGMVKDLKLTSITKLCKYQIEREREDMVETCKAICDSHRKFHAPNWLILAVDKIDLYYDRLGDARVLYSRPEESGFVSILRELTGRVGSDFFRWEVAPICGCLEPFTWNNKVEEPQITQEDRDAFLSQFLDLLRTYCS
jgi:hypothetical protein